MTKEDFCCEAVKEAVSGAQGAVRKRIKENGVTRDSQKEQEKKAMAQEWIQIENTYIAFLPFVKFCLLTFFALTFANVHDLATVAEGKKD